LQAQRQENIQLGVSEPEKAIKILQNAGWVVKPNGAFLTVKAKGHIEAMQINSLLIEHNVGVFHLVIEQPSLEMIFLNLTNQEKNNRSRS